MGKLPKKIMDALAETLHDDDLRLIEDEDGLDTRLDFFEYHISSDIERQIADEYDPHILTLVRGVRELRTIGETDAAIEVAIFLGDMLTKQELHSHLYFDRGKRAVEAGQKSAAATWGTFEQRRQKVETRRSLFERERPKFNSDQEAFEAVAKQCGVSWRTIRRTVTGN